jgi:hypothetical protein
MHRCLKIRNNGRISNISSFYRLTSQLLDPETLAEVFPDWEALQNPGSFFFRVLSGISSGLLYTLFFSFCPQLFKAIANFEGNVSSKRTAEDKALHYYWYFMLVTAFTGTSLVQMVGQGLVNGKLSFSFSFLVLLEELIDLLVILRRPQSGKRDERSPDHGGE